jgi:hypothetical protein
LMRQEIPGAPPERARAARRTAWESVMALLLERLLSCTALADPSVAADAAASASMAGCGAMLIEDLEARQLMTVTISGGDCCGSAAPSGCPVSGQAVLVEPATLSHT